MKLRDSIFVSTNQNRRGFTIAEMLIATALAGVVMALVLGTFKYTGTSFAAMGNYSDLDRKSRTALDLLGREIRNSSALIAVTTNPKSLTFTNATTTKKITVTYNSTARTLTLAKTGETTKTILTQCDQWDYSLFNKAPNLSSTNILFYGATNGAGAIDLTACKLVNMTWKCSRTILGSKRNTESIQTAQIVLRNKVN
jgi:prepilin-type N-terminal cleavage/methylation domain-containing protein